MSDMPLPYDEIQERGDRSWTMRLIERLKIPDLSDEEQTEVIWSLEKTDDPRMVEPLVSVLTDQSYPETVRDAAGAVLIWSGSEPHPQLRRAYWASGDE